MHFFEPDIIVEAELGLADSIGYGALARNDIEPQLVSLDELHSTKWLGHSIDFYVGQSIVDIYRADYESRHQFILREEVPAFLFNEDRLPSLVEAIFGAFPKEEDAAYFQALYRDAYSPRLVNPEPSAWLSVFKGEANSAFYPTSFELEIDPQIRSETTFFFLDHTKTTDLIEYWNMRLYRKPVYPIPLCWLSELMDFVSDEVNRIHRPVPNNRSGTMFRSQMVFSCSIEDDVEKHILKSLSAQCSSGSFFVSHSVHPRHFDSWRSLKSARHSVKSSEARLSLDVEENSVSFPLPYPKFADKYGGGRYRWANVVNFSSRGPTELALCYPPNIEDRAFPNNAMGQRGPIVSREGWVLLERMTESKAFLKTETGTDAICRWLKRRKIDARVSPAGRIALQMIDKLATLQVADLIADKETIQLLNRMAMQERVSSSKLRSNTRTFEGRTADTGRWHELVNRRAKSAYLFRVSLDQFTNRGILKLGLGLECPHCTHGNWYGLDDIGYRVICERCLKEFSYPQGSREPRWKYRVIGPFSVPNYAEGAYAVALTLATFAKRLTPIGDVGMTMTAGLNLKGQAFDREIDFAFWFRVERTLDYKAEPRFIVGEAKSFADQAIEKDDLDALQAVATLLPGTVLVVSVLKDSFSIEEKRLLRNLVRWGRVPVEGRMRAPVILLTGVELFSRWTVEESWRQRGDPYPADADLSVFLDLEDFAIETQRIYLGNV